MFARFGKEEKIGFVIVTAVMVFGVVCAVNEARKTNHRICDNTGRCFNATSYIKNKDGLVLKFGEDETTIVGTYTVSDR